jgi:DAACS family dicarboxylate/amino acid:cation (Na+ or H+) symporter
MPSSAKLHNKIFAGMIIGIIGGLLLQHSGIEKETVETITQYVKPLGDIFLRMIFMMVIPLIISALSLGVADLGSLRRIGRVGLRTLSYTIIVSAISVLIGISMVGSFEPGRGISENDRQLLIERYGGTAPGAKNDSPLGGRGIGDIIATIVPKNPLEDMTRAFDPSYSGGGLLAIMFFALMIGVALSLLPGDKTKTFKAFLEGLYEVVMKVIEIGMKLAPLGVAALLFTLTATFGFSILGTLLGFVFVVVGGLLFHMFVTYSILLKTLGRMSPLFFFRNIREVIVTAFSTSSSNATLPTAIRVALENLRLRRDVTQFVMTIGSTANQNGTALYEGVTVLFLAQVFGVELDISQQVFVVVMSILGGIGTAGVPGGSLPIIVLILISVGVPGEGIAIIYGVDRILDMCRTVLNVTGDLTAAVYVHRLEEASP